MKIEVVENGIQEFVTKASNLKLGTAFFEAVGAVIGGDIIGNIEDGRQADGSSIKENAPSTKRKKQRQGNAPIRSLVDVERRFIRRGKTSWNWVANSKSVTIEPTGIGKSAPLYELVREVQEKGYTGWFGVSKKAHKAIRALLRKRVEKILKKATR